MENILGDETSADYVALLQQNQASVNGIIYNSDGSVASQQYGVTNLNVVDQVVRTVSDNQINWLKPGESADFVSQTRKIAHHVGWHFDLPENGERAVKDVLIASGRLIFTTSTPSSSPCAGGGVSYIWAVDACTGARTAGAFFDLNNDGIINQEDYINIGTEADPIWVAPSSVAVGGIAPAPTLVEVQQGLDRLYFPDSSGPSGGEGPPPIQGMGTIGYGMPILHWRELDWQ
jgi:type IV pilus assembly protein PilY1